MTQRRRFLGQLGAIATAVALDTKRIDAASAPPASPGSQWDTSWLERLASAQFRAVFNANEISDGAAMHYAAMFLDHFRDVHATADQQTRAVIVFRRLGTQMAFNDLLWDRYAIGKDLKINDPANRSRAKRNVFWRAQEGESAHEAATKLNTLNQRGLISLVCNISLEGWSARMAERHQRTPDEVRAEVGANLVPGAIVVPSGIYALIRAQNAGCAYMPGV